MAVVTGFEPSAAQTVRLQPTELTCEFRVGRLSDGRRVLQLDTSGSAQQQEQGKKSQTLQFPEAQARELWELLGTHFGFGTGKA